METFDPDWLALREPIDHRSRAGELTLRLGDWWSKHGAQRVVDLGSGAGSNVRYLAPRLPGRQAWTVVDHDPDLLSRIQPAGAGNTVRRVVADLADEAVLADVAGPGRGTHLVTASALIDLVSEFWLRMLVDNCADAGCAVLLTLTYDGAIVWSADTGRGESDDTLDALHPLDEAVRSAVNAHQRRDKGLGPALGPSAGGRAEDLFRRRGYQTWTASSPWKLGLADAELVRALVAGWVTAAAEEQPGRSDAFREWGDRRMADVEHGSFRLVVGHVDVLALPPDGNEQPEHAG